MEIDIKFEDEKKLNSVVEKILKCTEAFNNFTKAMENAKAFIDIRETADE